MKFSSENQTGLLPEEKFPIGTLIKSELHKSELQIPLQPNSQETAPPPLNFTLNLNDYLISHPSSTFFMRARSNSMIGAGIYDGDLLIVDRSLTAQDKKVIVAIWNGEFTVKRLRRQESRFFLESTLPGDLPWEITPESDFQIWGVVTSVIHAL